MEAAALTKLHRTESSGGTCTQRRCQLDSVLPSWCAWSRKLAWLNGSIDDARYRHYFAG